MFGNVILDIESAFEEVFDAKKKQKKRSSTPISTQGRELSPSTRKSSRSTPSVTSRRTLANNWSWRAMPCSAPGRTIERNIIAA